MQTIKKTRRDFLTLMMSIITIIVIGSLIAIYLVTYTNIASSNATRLQSLEELNTIVKSDGNLSTSSFEVRSTDEAVNNIGSYIVMLVDKDKNTIYQYSSIYGDTVIVENMVTNADLVRQKKTEGKKKSNDRTWQYKIVEVEPDENYVVHLGGSHYVYLIDVTESQQSLYILIITLGVIGVILLGLFFVFSLYVSKRATKPMIDVLEQQQQFIADASHELKTPISIIKANCGVLQTNGNETIDSQKEWVQNIQNGADRMTQLIQNLITVTKIDDSDIKIIKSRICLEELLEEIMDTMGLLIAEKELSINIDTNGKTIIENDPNLIHQVITIILDNAIKYSNHHGQIDIKIKQEKKGISLAIGNTGEGIAKEDMDKIFHRFYRSEKARTQNGSYGLGLSIAATIMEQINGKITVASEEGKYALFTLYF